MAPHDNTPNLGENLNGWKLYTHAQSFLVVGPKHFRRCPMHAISSITLLLLLFACYPSLSVSAQVLHRYSIHVEALPDDDPARAPLELSAVVVMEEDYDDKTLKEIENALDSILEKKATSDRQRLGALIARGEVWCVQQRPEAAFPYLIEAYELATDLPEADQLRGIACGAYGTYLHYYQVPELAIKPLLESLPGLRLTEHPIHFLLRDIYNDLFRSYLKLGNTEKILELTAKLGEDLQREGRPHSIANGYNNAGLFLQEAGLFDQAVEVFARALSALDTTVEGHLLIYVNILESRSHAYVAKGKAEQALDDLYYTYRVRKRIGDYRHAMQALAYVLKYSNQYGSLAEALRFFLAEETYVRSEKKIDNRTYQLYEQLGLLFRKVGDVNRAEKYERLFYHFIATVRWPRIQSQQPPPNLNAYLNLRNQHYAQEKYIANLEASQLREELRNRNLWLLLLGAIALSTGIGWYVYRLRSREKAAARLKSEADRQRILELKNDNLKYRLESNARDLRRLAADNRVRTKMKQEFLEKLRELQHLPLQNKENELRKLANELDVTVNDQEGFNQLQDRIDVINTEYETYLRSQIRGITVQEIRLCSLLKLGMTNQQIAKLLNKSDTTIRSYRFRLRKKAGVHTSAELLTLIEAA